jgi:hypothetical protein
MTFIYKLRHVSFMFDFTVMTFRPTACMSSDLDWHVWFLRVPVFDWLWYDADASDSLESRCLTDFGMTLTPLIPLSPGVWLTLLWRWRLTSLRLILSLFHQRPGSVTPLNFVSGYFQIIGLSELNIPPLSFKFTNSLGPWVSTESC